MPTTTRKRSRKPITTRVATAAELDRRTGRERKEDAAKARASQPKPRRRGKPRTKATSKPVRSEHDFTVDGVRVHNARQVDGKWYVDLTNGDATATLHNRHGSWMHDVDGNGRMQEPVRAARNIGISGMDQLEVCQLLMRRVAREPAHVAAMAAKAAAKSGTKPAKVEDTAAEETSTTNTNQKEATTMARKPRSTATADKAATTKPAAKPRGNGANKRTFTKKEIVAIAKQLREGTPMKDIWGPMGMSTGQPIRAALVEHGFDSKGRKNPDGLTAREIQERDRAAKANGKGEAKATRSRAKAAQAEEATADAEDEEEDEEETEAEESAEDRRKRLRRESRAKRTAKAKGKGSRKPRAKATDPS